MKFVTNRISTGKSKSFDDIIKEYQQGKVKTASSQTVVKTAEADEAESSGQLAVEPLHQDGESTTMPKAGPSAKKECCDGEKAAKADTNPEEEGEDSGQPKAEGSEKLTNDPKVEKEAGIENLPQAVQDKIKGKKTDDDDDSGKEAKVDEKDEEKEAKVDEKDEEKEAKVDEKDEEKEAKVDEKDDEEKEAKADEKDDEEKEAKSIKFVKIGNLNSKNKSFLKKFWSKMYGDDYVNAMLADK